MIPKRIIYCWFGGKPLPESAQKCIDSWRKYCPDYEIVEINEGNFDVNVIPYTRQMYKQKKFAFVSDYARLKAVYEYGGIYLDTDVELLRDLEPLLAYRCYFGFECKTMINSGQGFGAEQGTPVLKDMMQIYEQMVPENGSFTPVICTQINTDAFDRYGLVRNGKTQFFENDTIAVFSPEYFNPWKTDGVVNKTENTFSVHWYDASWITPWMRIRIKISVALQKILGEPVSIWIRKRNPFRRRK